MSAEPNIIGIGAVVSGRAEYDAAQARIERLKAEAEAARWTETSLWAWVPPIDVAIVVAAVAVLVFGTYEAASHLLARPSATAPAAAIPCAGPGLNEHTYIVLANDAGQIRLQSCTTVHILGR